LLPAVAVAAAEQDMAAPEVGVIFVPTVQVVKEELVWAALLTQDQVETEPARLVETVVMHLADFQAEAEAEA
jgi:hypothetical protein